MEVNSSNFEYVSKLVKEHSSIVLESGKEYLVNSRLYELAKDSGFKGLNDFIADIRNKPFNSIHKKIIELMTTNETSFFRDFYPFETLKNDIIPEMLERKKSDKTIRIWSAACSTGQEPYSIAMILRDAIPDVDSWRIVINATDLSTTILEYAKRGVYKQVEVNRGLPVAYILKYFEQIGTEWKLKDEIRKMVVFEEINLNKPFPWWYTFDVIFMRNVLIYFEIETKKLIFEKLKQCLAPESYLFLGNAETTINLDAGFEPVTLGKSVCYRLKKI
ncbi:MAG: protein-glutamate O-methyltransferase CheR [Leptospiraceae bacterium]|nr:protein-glutamate O-methyltransferase CheR [Leptospiraceae bacterium]MCP5493668.1 protein-glutamate O-methyltransferase CheR [Leptospiraceae bacterium]